MAVKSERGINDRSMWSNGKVDKSHQHLDFTHVRHHCFRYCLPSWERKRQRQNERNWCKWIIYGRQNLSKRRRSMQCWHVQLKHFFCRIMQFKRHPWNLEFFVFFSFEWRTVGGKSIYKKNFMTLLAPTIRMRKQGTEIRF